MVISIQIETSNLSIDVQQDCCPICHFSIEPRIVKGEFLRLEGRFDAAEVVYRCPRVECGSLFICRYERRPDGSGSFVGPYYRVREAPVFPKPPEISSEIRSLSSNYAELIEQSHAAEKHGLSQIAGPGYRKALEYLVKDFAVHKNSGDKEHIQKMFLAKCIEEFITHPKIKDCAKRAAWLGNDETHYLRKWETKDIEDLKTLIRLTESWMLSDLLTEKYLTEMS